MAKLGIQTSSSPFDYTKLLAPIVKEVEAREKKMDEIDTLETSLSALNNYLEGENPNDPIIKQYYGMQKDAENLSEKWAKGEINDKQLRDKIKSIKATYSKTVPILSEAIKNRQEALRSQRLGEASGAVYLQGYEGSSLSDWYNGKMPEAKMLDAQGLMKAAILEGQSVGQAKGRTNHDNKVRTTTIGNKIINFLPYEIGLAPNEDNIANVYNSRASKLAEQFGVDVNNPTVRRLITQGLTEGLSRSYKTGEETFQGTSSGNNGGSSFNFNFGNGRSVPQGLTKTQWLVQLTDQDSFYTDPKTGKTLQDKSLVGQPTEVYQDGKGNYYILKPSFKYNDNGTYSIEWSNLVSVGKNLDAFYPFTLEYEFQEHKPEVKEEKNRRGKVITKGQKEIPATYTIYRRYGNKNTLVHPIKIDAAYWQNDPYSTYKFIRDYNGNEIVSGVTPYYGDRGVQQSGNNNNILSSMFGDSQKQASMPSIPAYEEEDINPADLEM